jgi:hypothetical protein
MNEDMLETLNTYWQQQYPDMWPLAYNFKELYKRRWVRFHSLPESKRYPENEAEYDIILERHNSVIDYLNSSQPNTLLLISSEWDGLAIPNRFRSHLLKLDPNAICWKSLAMSTLHGDEDNSTYQHLYVSEWTWRKGVFDPVLRLVANDVVANVMIVNISGKWLYHPYDGGADIILASSEARDILRDKYKLWLSNHLMGY